MTIVFNNHAEVGSASGATTIETAAFAVANNAALLAFVGNSDSPVGVPSFVKWRGVAGEDLTLLDAVNGSGIFTYNRWSMWMLDAATADNNTGHVTYSQIESERAVAFASFTGVDQTTPRRDQAGNDTAVNNGTGTTASITVATQPGDVVFAGCSAFYNSNVAGRTQSSDATDIGTADANYQIFSTAYKVATGTSTTITWTITTAPHFGWATQGVALIPAAVSSVPNITDIDTDEIIAQGQTSVGITGSVFGATQGTGTVIISPTDNINDVNAVAQTITGWSDTAIIITADFTGTGIAEGVGCFVFVTNDAGDSNAAGFAITREDLTAPTLTNTTPTVGITTATVGANTDEPGTAYLCMYLPSEVTPSSDGEVIAGTYANAVGQQTGLAVSAGAFTFTQVAGLSAGTGYSYKVIVVDGMGNQSVTLNNSFTTNAAVQFITDVVNNAGTIMANAAVSWSWFPAGRIGSFSSITPVEGTGPTDANGQLTVTGITAGSGLLMIAVLNTDATDDDVFYQAGVAA